MEAVKIEEIQKPTAKKSSKRGRKSKKNNTKVLQESPEITHDDKSDTKESESSPEMKDTTIYSQNVVQNNITENVLIDESLALESPEKPIVSQKVATIVEVDSEELKNSMEPEIKVEDEQTETNVEKNHKAEEISPSEVIKVAPVVVETPIVPVEEMICSDENKDEKNKSIVEMSSSEVVPVESIAVVVDVPILSSTEVEKIEPTKQMDCSVEVQDTVPTISEKIDPVEEMDCSEEVQELSSTNKCVEVVEKVAPVEAMNCSEEVQDVASSSIICTITQVEETKRTVDILDPTPMISDKKDEIIEPVMKNNEIEIKIKKEKDIYDTPVEQEVLNKSPTKEILTRKSESYTVEQLENIEERCESPDLMDESVVTIMDSPPPLNGSALAKDSTFSPVVDISINDSRPTIDLPILKRNNPLRTSTPLAPKLFLTTCGNQNSNRKLMLNPLEKSILKSNRRKRSLSMVEGESFMQKRVMFISPTVMDIESIDHKMMASFIEEKENSSKFNDILIYIHFDS